MDNIRNVPEKRSCNRKSLEYLFSDQLSVQINIKFVFTLTVSSLERAVQCDDICATNQDIVLMPHQEFL